MGRAIAILVMFFAGCGTLTPAQRLAIDVISCRYKNIYVPSDSALSEQEKADRVQMTNNLRATLNLHLDCDAGR